MITEKEIKKWYNCRYDIKGEKAWRPYEAYSVFLDYLKIESAKRLLDVGSGTGFLLKDADKRGLETYGIDISENSVEIARNNSPNSKIFVSNGENLPFSDNYFDYITCVGVLEHFLDIFKGIREMKRVGKNSALFCIAVPNSNFLYWKLKSKKGTDQRNINENLYSLEEWKELFNREGFKILEIYKDKWFIKFQYLKRIIHELAQIFIPLNYTYQFVFIMKK